MQTRPTSLIAALVLATTAFFNGSARAQDLTQGDAIRAWGALPTYEGISAETEFYKCVVTTEEDPPPPKLKLDFNIPGIAADPVDDGKHVTFSAAFNLQQGSRRGTLTLTAKIDDGWHVFSITQKPGGPMASKIKVIESDEFKALGPFQPDQPPSSTKLDIYNVPVEEHEHAVTWSAPVEFAEGVQPKDLAINLEYSGQVCSATVCIPIFKEKVAAAFAGYAEVTRSIGTAGTSSPGGSATATTNPPAKPIDFAALMPIIGFGLLGGLILNLMPCVLPVIGLKVLSFAQQGGESRTKIFTLNLWYVLGLMFVFFILATLATFGSLIPFIGQNLAWGEQFTRTDFKVAMVVIVFAFALSFLGVWEVPIPGFAQSNTSSKLQQREGASGAFFKGVLTTILATPCSAPFLGPVFAYTLAQPPLVTYIIFGSVGLGMASPYLVIGAFPSLVRWLPKPGEWMETFKQLMGFVLLGTVVYLFATINADYFIPTLALVVGVWFACWLIGRVPVYESADKQLWAWISGCAAAAAIGWAAFSFLGPAKDLLNWQPYSAESLSKLQAEGKTVMVDFTADWCLTCQYNSKTAINTTRVREAVEKYGVTPLLADWTDNNAAIKQKLAELNSNSIPLLAIYPAGRPGEVIILRDALVESQVLSALDKAGPSQGTSAASSKATAETAMAQPTR